MLTRQQFLESVAEEIKVCKHLYGKIDLGKLGYQPGENTRTTLEVMRYLTWCGSAPADALVNGDWSVLGPYQETASEMPAEEFPARMDAQRARIEELIGKVPEEELPTKEVTLPWGRTMTLGAALVNTTLKFLATYRLQFFNQIKCSGSADLNTYNVWMGMDKPEE